MKWCRSNFSTCMWKSQSMSSKTCCNTQNQVSTHCTGTLHELPWPIMLTIWLRYKFPPFFPRLCMNMPEENAGSISYAYLYIVHRGSESLMTYSLPLNCAGLAAENLRYHNSWRYLHSELEIGPHDGLMSDTFSIAHTLALSIHLHNLAVFIPQAHEVHLLFWGPLWGYKHSGT